MGLKIAATWRRLKVLLEYHQVLVAENRQKERMDKVGRKIKRLTWLLEQYNKKNGDGSHYISGDE